MSVIERLYAVLAPLSQDDERDIMPSIPGALTWRPRADPRRWRSVVLKRIDAAGAALSVEHIYWRAWRGVTSAINLTTPELALLKKVAR